MSNPVTIPYIIQVFVVYYGDNLGAERACMKDFHLFLWRGEDLILGRFNSRRVVQVIPKLHPHKWEGLIADPAGKGALRLLQIRETFTGPLQRLV